MPATVQKESSDDSLMLLALSEAEQGLGLTSPNPPVGAVIVKDETILGKGWHRKAGGPHAEIEALRDAREKFGSESIRDSSIFVTLEPCSTHGKTPPCVEAIIEAGIGRVVIGCLDPNPAHSGSASSILKKVGVDVVAGVCEEQARHLIRFFSRHIVTGLPYVIAKTATTLDGRTTLPKEMGQWISSKESREDVQALRRQMDAVLVGGETMRVDNPRLTIRGENAAGRDTQPLRVVLTSRPDDLPKNHHLFTDEFADRTQIFSGNSLATVLADLGRQGVTSVLLESGGRLFAQGMAEGLIDEVVLYIAPMIGGGTTRLMPQANDNLLTHLETVSVEKIGPDTKITAQIVKSSLARETISP